MDCWWNAAIENQGKLSISTDRREGCKAKLPKAIDRVHRIGQEKTVYVTHFIVSRYFLLLSFVSSSAHRTIIKVSNTIEGRILKIQKRKTAIIKEALKGQTGADSESVENLRIMFGEQEED